MLEVIGVLDVTPLDIWFSIRVKQFYDNFRSIFHESIFDLFHNFRAGIGGCSCGPRTKDKKLLLKDIQEKASGLVIKQKYEKE
jgi:hypothetical protein